MIKESNIDIDSVANSNLHSINTSSQRLQSKSPSALKTQAKPPAKKHPKRINKLAFQYSEKAHEMKMKKGYIKDKESTLTGSDQPFQTPNFKNLASTSSNFDETSPERIQMPPHPSEQPMIYETLTQHKVERSNHQQLNALNQSRDSNQIGTIIKSNQNVSSKTRENSEANQQRVGRAGMIVRQRSTSPRSLLGLNKENQSFTANQSQVMAGQIVRTNTQKLNQTMSYIDQDLLATPKSDGHYNQFGSINLSERKAHHNLKSAQISEQDNASLWDYLKFGCEQLKQLSKNNTEASNCEQILQKVIDYQNEQQKRVDISEIYPLQLQRLDYQHRRIIVQNLNIIYKQRFIEELPVLKELKMRLDERKNSLKEVIKETCRVQNQYNPQGLLKVEILKDICLRLTQKIVLQILKIKAEIRRDLVEQFDFCIDTLNSKQLRILAFYYLKQNLKRQKEKKDYVSYAQLELKQTKLKQVFSVWKNIQSFKDQRIQKLKNASSLLLTRKFLKILTQWKVYVIQHRNKDLSNSLVHLKLKQKYCHYLFGRWVSAIREHSKIKRKALQMVTHKSQIEEEIGSLRGPQKWLSKLKEKSEELMFSAANEYLLERAHNKDFISSLIYKLKPEELEQKVSISSQVERTNSQNRQTREAYQSNESKIYRQYPQLRSKSPNKIGRQCSLDKHDSPIHGKTMDIAMRNSMDDQSLNVKYQIHMALVNQQNNNSSAKMRNSFSQITQDQSAILFQQQNTQNFRQLIPPVPQRLIFQQEKQQNSSQPAPNKLYEQIEQQISKNQQNKFIQSYFDKQSELPLSIQIQDHIKSLKFNMYLLIHNQPGYHYSQSLKVKVPGSEELDQMQVYTVSDYIQFGLSSEHPRMAFINLFQNRVKSKLFTQWKVKFTQRWINSDLNQLHTINAGKQCFSAWASQKQVRIQEAKNFNSAKALERFYLLFKQWRSYSNQVVYEDIKKIKQLRMKMFFRGWVRYLEKQGDFLQRILRSQQYYKQALQSKALLAFYQFHLKEMRISKFIKNRTFKKFFKKTWQRKFSQKQKLRMIFTKITEKIKTSEQMRYSRQFQLMKEVLLIWRSKIVEQKEQSKEILAQSHYFQSIQYSYFSKLKQHWKGSKLSATLKKLALTNLLFPAFFKLKKVSQIQKKTQSDWSNYRQEYLKQQVLYKWRKLSMNNKLAKLCLKKKYWNYFASYIKHINYFLPRRYRQKRLKQYFVITLKEILRLKWKAQRSRIIENEMVNKRRERVLKIVYLKFLENILIQKKKRLISSTIFDFKHHSLKEKAFIRLKLFWSQRKKERIMKSVAVDFHKKIVRRRELRLKHYYEQNGMKYQNEGSVTKNRIFTHWKMRTQDKKRQYTVASRFITYKQRLLLLRCILSWRQISKYEQTFRSQTSKSTSKHNLPLQAMGHSYYQTTSNKNLSTKGLAESFDMKQNMLSYSYGKGFDDITQVLPPGESPYKGMSAAEFMNTPGGKGQEKSLFDELDQIFSKNQKWLDEQREREQFLREMAAHYNQTLSQEMSTLKYSTEKLQTISDSKQQRRY